MATPPLNSNYTSTFNNIHGPNYQVTVKGTAKHPTTERDIPFCARLLIAKNTTSREQKEQIENKIRMIVLNPPQENSRRESSIDLILAVSSIFLCMFLHHLLEEKNRCLPPLRPYL